MAKRDFEVNAYGVELQKELFSLSLYNRQKNTLDVTYINIDVKKFKPTLLFDFVVSNPPFYPSTTKKTDNKSINIARYEDTLNINELLSHVAKLLKSNGHFIFCYRADRLGYVFDALRQNNFFIHSLRFVYSKPQRDASLVLLCVRKTQLKLTKVLPAFFSNINDKPSKELRLAIKKANAKSIN